MLGEEHRLLRDALRDFAAQRLAPHAAEWDRDAVFPRAALKELAAHFFAPGAKERSIKYVPITRKIEGREHMLTVGTVGECSGHLIDGGFAGAPKVSNPPFSLLASRRIWS